MKLSKFHIRTTKPTRRNNVKLVVLWLGWLCDWEAHATYC